MNALSRLRAVRAILAAGVGLRALLWGGAAALTLLTGVALVDIIAGLPLAERRVLLVLAIVSCVCVAATLAWRDRAVLSLERVALWVEERFPALEYALATGVESGNQSFVIPADVTEWTGRASRSVARVLGPPAAVLVAAAAVLLLLPAGAVARVRTPHPGDALDRSTGFRAANATRLAPLVADIAPPAYSGERATSVDEPTDVRTLVGSTVTLRGRGDPSGIVAHAGPDSLAAVRDGDRWQIVYSVSSRPVAIQLGDRAFRRVIAIEPIVDAAPAVTLATPAHDTVLRAPRGRIPLSADATDDFGIATASFEFIVSSGEGETFTFRSGTLGAIRPNAKHATWAASLSIDSLALKPGDIVHLRAVARDANTVSGPGLGASETRAIRIARADEYDSVSVDPVAPSEAEKGVVSERMLIMLAEALEQKRPSLKRDALVSESRSIATDQKKLRRSVGDIVFTRLGSPSGEEHSDDDSPARGKSMEALLARADSATNRSADPIDFEGGESPVVAVNKPLLEAYNAMWDAGTSLELGEPAKALPFMRRALAAIQRARQAERIYLRGTPPPVVIDIDKARLKGKDRGASSTRRPLTAADSMARARTERFMRIVEQAAHDPHAVADSLLLLRIDALGDNSAFAAALGDAAAAMRRGKGDAATAALARARRALAGAAVSRDSLTRWGIIP